MCITWQANRMPNWDGNDPNMAPDYGKGCRCKKDELKTGWNSKPRSNSSGAALSSGEEYDTDSSEWTGSEYSEDYDSDYNGYYDESEYTSGSESSYECEPCTTDDEATSSAIGDSGSEIEDFE